MIATLVLVIAPEPLGKTAAIGLVPVAKQVNARVGQNWIEIVRPLGGPLLPDGYCRGTDEAGEQQPHDREPQSGSHADVYADSLRIFKENSVRTS
jgi:hypothetical protein